MKKNHLSFIGRFAFAMLPLFSVSGVRGGEPVRSSDATIAGEVNGGGQTRFIKGDKPKFNEYRDLENNAVLNDFKLRFEDDLDPAKGPFDLDFEAANLLKDDQFYRLRLGQRDTFKAVVQFDSIPHSFTGRELLFGGAGGNYLTISPGARATLQGVEQTRAARGGNPLTDTTGGDATSRTTVRGLFPDADRGVFKIKREKTSVSLDYDVTEQIRNWVRFSSEERSGARVINAGTYERFPQGATALTHAADLFFISGAELAEPINYQTSTLSVGTGVYEAAYQADVEYKFTDFENTSTALTWDNPFRTTDATATSAAGGAGNGFNRGRFATGQLSLTPSSFSHDLCFSGGVDLPWRSHFSGSVSVGWITQDTPFVPYTRNSAISGLAGFDVTDVSNLPQKSLGGLVRTVNQSYVLTSKPVDHLDLTTRYRNHLYEDQSDQIRFPGYAAFGESHWRRVRNDLNAPVENKPFSYIKHTVEASADYHVVSPLNLILEGGWEGWDRARLRVTNTDESKVGSRFVYRPFTNVKMEAGYMHYDRSMEGYLPGVTSENPEAIGLVNYDVADRERHKGRGGIHITPSDQWTLGVSGEVVDDVYAADSRFGLKESRGYSTSLDTGYSVTEDITLHAGYGYERDRSLMKSGAKDDAFNLAGSLDDAFTTDAWNPNNYWNTTITDQTHTVSTGAAFKCLGKKLDFDLSYILSFGQQEYINENPNGAVKLHNAVAHQWPVIDSVMHEARADALYNITPDLSVGASYLFEIYSLHDFTWNTSAYMADATAENTTRYIFSDANYTGYTAHVVQLFLKWKF